MPEHHKRNRAVHITALKRWHPPVADVHCLLAEQMDSSDIPDYRPDPDQSFPELSQHLSNEQRDFFKQVWIDFPTVTSTSPGRTQAAIHRSNTGTALPIRLRPYRIPQVWEEAFRVEIQKMKDAGYIEPSSAPWAAPMFPVPKKQPGEIRLVCDYRRLNVVTVPDPYYQPRVEETLERMATASFFTILDLARGFYQVPIAMEDRDKTTVVTPLGKFRFVVMPFGLRNAPATFQRLMDDLLGSCNSFTNVYIDDVAIFSIDWEDHTRHVRAVFDILKTAGLTIQPTKAQLGSKSCTFLGHEVGHGFISPQEAKTKAIREFQRPATKKDIRAFLGLAGYYRRFIYRFSSIAAPLTDLTRAAFPDLVQWTPDCETAFIALKESLCSDPVLRPPDYKRNFMLQTDASGRGIGAVLAQTDDSNLDHPIAYFSRKLMPRETRYSATEQEGLAVVAAYKHFLPYLLGHHFTVITDHRALAFLSDKDPQSGRLARWMDVLRQFSFTIQYRPGVVNGNADGLSRQAWPPNDQIPTTVHRLPLEGGGDVGIPQQVCRHKPAGPDSSDAKQN